MLQKHHKHHIFQTSFATISLLVFGGGLFFLAQPSLKATARDDNPESMYGETYKFPDTTLEIPTIEEYQDYKSNPTQKYLVQPQNLPVYIVKSVVDGNTIVVEGNKRIRLIGIKSPDKDEEFGIEATDFLKKLLDNRDIYFQIDDKNPKDSFGRLRGIVYISRKNVNIEILRNGYAHIYPTTPSIVGDTDWIQFENEAKEFKRGLWSGEKSGAKKEDPEKDTTEPVLDE